MRKLMNLTAGIVANCIAYMKPISRLVTKTTLGENLRGRK